ncbi:hypothetical protein [Salarchaeum japonicum]|uniref:Uncharacterized protein n=1 Tax=Salarchaeum japonicum TaxID=555573 RepID=A0AAV3T3M4_9EURY|nr:hypothetical protein [Salarchaeum japonicum]
MDSVRAAGGLLTALSLLAYAAGVLQPYPGRAFSVTGVMVGVTLAAVGRPTRGDGA